MPERHAVMPGGRSPRSGATAPGGGRRPYQDFGRRFSDTGSWRAPLPGHRCPLGRPLGGRDARSRAVAPLPADNRTSRGAARGGPPAARRTSVPRPGAGPALSRAAGARCR